jgi:hypothetical protein
MRENPLGGKLVMPIKRYKAEQIVTMLRQIEVSIDSNEFPGAEQKSQPGFRRIIGL